MPAKKTVRKELVGVRDFALLKHPRSLALSPDGTRLAYTVQWCEFDKQKSFSNLHVLDTESGESRQWTFGEHSDRNPVWSRDGERLAFCRSLKGVDHIFVIPRDGGEAELLYKTRSGIGGIRWAENDSSIIVRFRQADPDTDADKAFAEGRDIDVKAPAVRKITRLSYRFDGDGFLPEDRWHLCRLDLETRELETLTHGKADVTVWDISPDGETIAYVTNVHRDPDLHPFHEQILLLNLRTRKIRSLELPFGEKQAVSFSPNGKYLVYLGHHNIEDGWGIEPVHPWLVDLASGKKRNLTPGYDRQPGDLIVSDLGHGLGSPVLFWSDDSRSIFYQITDEGDVWLARTGLRTKEPERIFPLPGQIALMHAEGSRLALLHVDFNTLGEIYVCDDVTAKAPAFRSVAEFNRDYLAARTLSKIREIRFKSGDGIRLHGWLLLPPGFNPRKKYPAILEVHGGPRTQYGRVFFHEMQYLAAQGYVVFMTNPRGSQGYGREFAGSIEASWGTDDFADIMAAADWLDSQKFVDRKRVGITGGSYGGYMTNFAIGRTHRFRAAVTQRSVVDLKTFCGCSDIGYMDNYEFGGYYWENPDGYAAMSPLTYADNMRTPLLILHNEHDYRCAIEQAEQLYARLKIMGKCPVEFWRFPEEPHGLSRSGRPDRRVIRLEGISGWFKKWMK